MFAATLLTRAASAEDDPRKVRAEAFFNEGVKLHTAGKNEEALAKLREAYEIFPSPNTLSGIARVEQALGRKIDALKHYREALANPLLHPQNAEYAKKAVSELEAETAHVDIKGPPGLVVQVDGKEVTLPLAQPLDTEPKTISVTGKAGDKEYVGSASCPAGKLTVIELRLVQNDVAGDTTPPPEEPSSSWTTGKTLGLVLWGGAVLAAGAGTYFTIAANRAASDIDDVRARTANPDGACVGISSPDCSTRQEAADDRVMNSNLALGSFVGAGALLVGGALAFFAWPKSKDSSTGVGVSPIVTSTTWGLGFGRAF